MAGSGVFSGLTKTSVITFFKMLTLSRLSKTKVRKIAAARCVCKQFYKLENTPTFANYILFSNMFLRFTLDYLRRMNVINAFVLEVKHSYDF